MLQLLEGVLSPQQLPILVRGYFEVLAAGFLLGFFAGVS